MRKFSAFFALCLAVLLCAGCGRDPVQTTAPKETTPVQTLPAEPTAAPTEDPSRFDNGRFTLTLPEGFTEEPGTDNLFRFASPEAPADPSCIEVEILPLDEDVLTMSTSDYRKRIDPTKQISSTALRFKLIDLWEEEVDGWPCVVSEYNLVYEDYIAHLFRYEIVCRSANFIFTFSDGSDDNVWLEQFAQCMETVTLNQTEGSTGESFGELTEYALDCGLRLFAESGLIRHGAAGFTECLGSRSAIILFMADNKEVNHLTQMDLADYAALLRSTNDLGQFRQDIYGNLYTSFHTTAKDGTDYFNMIFLKETEDAFWVCQMACTADAQSHYETEFPLWASSITEQ